MIRIARVLFAVVVLAGVSIPVAARGDEEQPARKGRIIHLDEEGRPTRPPPGAVDREPPTGRRAVEPGELREQRLPDGGVGIELDERFHSFGRATVGENGKVETECSHHEKDEHDKHGKEEGR